MERTIYSQLATWKSSSRRKPLILQGARQVGKTHALKAFGDTSYEQVFYFNFETEKRLHGFFVDDLRPEQIIQMLSLHRNTRISVENTLIIFAESQECPNALNSLKYFCEDAPEYHIAAAGSLLGVKLAPEGFPVGKVDFLTLHPMSFFEFLKAIGQDLLSDFCEKLSLQDRIPEAIHQGLLQNLKQYFIIGGMPEAVSSFMETSDYSEVRRVQGNILRTYELDFSKHAQPSDNMKISQIWESIPNQLAKENKKFIFNALSKTARAREYESSLQWLKKAGLIEQVYRISIAKIPLDAYSDKSAFKVYALDVGLLGAMADLPPQILLEQNQVFEEFKGALTENFVLQELKAAGKSTPYYWTSDGRAELDFVLQEQLEAFPLEVKAGASRHKKSLMVYKEKFQPSILSRATTMGLKLQDGLINYPLYLVSKFPLSGYNADFPLRCT